MKLKHELIDPLLLDGSDLASLLYFWNFMMTMNTNLILPSTIRTWLICELQKEEKKYDIEDLNTIYKSFDLLSFNHTERTSFKLFLQKKLFHVDYTTHIVHIEHVKEYLEITQIEEEGDSQEEVED